MRATTGSGFAAAVLLIVLTATAATGDPGLVYETTIEGYYLSAGTGLTTDEAGNAYVTARYIGDHGENNFVVARLDASGEVVIPASGVPGSPPHRLCSRQYFSPLPMSSQQPPPGITLQSACEVQSVVQNESVVL